MSKEGEECCLADQLWDKPRLLGSPRALALAQERTAQSPGPLGVTWADAWGALCLLSPRVSSETSEGEPGAVQGCAGPGGGGPREPYRLVWSCPMAPISQMKNWRQSQAAEPRLPPGGLPQNPALRREGSGGSLGWGWGWDPWAETPPLPLPPPFGQQP